MAAQKTINLALQGGGSRASTTGTAALERSL